MDLQEYQKTGRLNLDGFTNLKKSVLTEREFVEKFVQNGEYELFSEKSILDFRKSISDELVKGQYGADELKIQNQELARLQPVSYQRVS